MGGLDCTHLLSVFQPLSKEELRDTRVSFLAGFASDDWAWKSSLPCQRDRKKREGGKEVGKETEEGRETWVDIGYASGVIKISRNDLDI